MAEWGSEPIWTPFEEINGGQQFSKKFGAQDLNALAENIAYLYEHQPTATPIFDGTINIESGNTTISGSYLIDESKAYSALQSLSGVKTYNVNFSAGGSGSGMGDSIDFTSMTFDATSGLILYNDKGAFAMNGGFAEYTANYGDGNGARVNFYEGTECRKEFKELFLSIADEYVEVELGTFTYNQTQAWYSTPIVRKFPLGMTWGEFIESDYNSIQTDGSGQGTVTGQFVIEGSFVKFTGVGSGTGANSITLDVYSGPALVEPAFMVVDNGVYFSVAPGGGGSN